MALRTGKPTEQHHPSGPPRTELRSLRDLLEEQGISAVGGGAPGTEALTPLVESRPKLVLIDIDFGGDSGLALPRGR